MQSTKRLALLLATLLNVVILGCSCDSTLHEKDDPKPAELSSEEDLPVQDEVDAPEAEDDGEVATDLLVDTSKEDVELDEGEVPNLPDIPTQGCESGYYRDSCRGRVDLGESLCSEEVTPRALEKYREGEVSEDAPEVPELIWQRRRLCEDTPGLSHVVDAGSEFAAYGELTIGDQRREVIVTTLEQNVHTVLEPVVVAVVALDPYTGETLKCLPVPKEDYLVPTQLAISSELDRFYLALYSHEDLAGRRNVVRIGSFADDVEEVDVVVGHSYIYSSFALTLDGRLWVNSSGCGTHSFDPQRGDYLGSLSPSGVEDITDRCEKAKVKMPDHSGRDRVWSWSGVYWLNHCEVEERYGDLDTWSKKVDLGEVKIERVYQVGTSPALRIYSSSTGRLLEEVPGCNIAYVIDGAGRVLCAGQPPVSRLTLALVSTDGREVDRLDLLHPDWSGITLRGLVAGAEEHAIVSFDYSPKTPDAEVESGVMIVDLNEMTAEGYQPIYTLLPETVMGVFRGGVGTPMLTPSGMLVVPIRGGLYGLQTHIPGLAKSPYPTHDLEDHFGLERRGALDIGE